MLKTQSFVCLILLLTNCARPGRVADGCSRHLRAVMDVGSGSTKLNLSEVSACDGQIHLVRVIDDQSSVQVSLEAGKDAAGGLSVESQELAIKALTELRDKAFALARAQAPDFKEIEFAAVGTHAFRTASNASSLAERVRTLGFELVALPQEKEGEYGFAGVKQKGVPEGCKDNAPVVWDVGGGSMQIVTPGQKGELTVQKVPFGAETFKKRLIALSSSHSPRLACTFNEPSPNPIGWKNSTQAIATAQQMAANALSVNFKPQVRCVIGIGAVHGKAIEAQIRKLWPQIQGCACSGDPLCKHGEDSYNRKELQCLSLYLADKNDCDPAIQGPYSTTAVSNLFMITGFLERLKINQVYTMNVNMGTSLSTDTTLLPWHALSVKGH